MADWIDAILIVVVVLGIYTAGYHHGLWRAEKRAAVEQDVLLRMEPSKRTIGTPTNTESPPSEVREPQWRSGQFREGPDTNHPRGDA